MNLGQIGGVWWVRSAVHGGSDRPLSPPPTPASPPPPLKQRRSSLDRSFYLGLAGFCWGLSCRSCCLGLETEIVVLVGNEWESLGSSMKE